MFASIFIGACHAFKNKKNLFCDISRFPNKKVLKMLNICVVIFFMQEDSYLSGKRLVITKAESISMNKGKGKGCLFEYDTNNQKKLWHFAD